MSPRPSPASDRGPGRSHGPGPRPPRRSVAPRRAALTPRSPWRRYRNKFNCCDEVGVDRAVLKPWLRDTLLQWAQEFPVDFVEQLRNTRVCGLQKTRNPFVDFPALTEALVMELSRDAPYFKE